MKKILILMVVVPILLFVFKRPMMEFLDFLDGKQSKDNYSYENGKIVTKTILSEEDAKKPCKNCHNGKF